MKFTITAGKDDELHKSLVECAKGVFTQFTRDEIAAVISHAIAEKFKNNSFDNLLNSRITMAINNQYFTGARYQQSAVDKFIKEETQKIVKDNLLPILKVEIKSQIDGKLEDMVRREIKKIMKSF